MGLSRRDFLKMGGSACLVAGASAMAGAAVASAEEMGEGFLVGGESVNFTAETDILIIGTGISGLAAGMEPAMAGRKVTYVDKNGTFGLGGSGSSCWFMFGTGTELQLEAGYTTTIDESWAASRESSIAGYDQYDWYPMWVKGKTYANTHFIDTAINEFGAKFQTPASEAELPRLFARVVLAEHGIAGGVSDLMYPIQAHLEELGCEFVYDMRAKALIKDAEGAVIGCRFVNEETGETVDYKANAVVLATGGFIDNSEMVAKYVPSYTPYGTLVLHDMGEGHLMAWAAGAQVHGMDTTPIYCNLMGDIPNATTWGYWTPIVLVLPNGKRFIQEGQSHDAAAVADENGYREWWCLFDQRAFDCRCIGDSVNKNVVSHADRYVTADTIEEMAELMDVPVDNLVATFERYESLVDGGVDEDFGKTAWLEKLQPPYHALRLNVCRYKTSGGLIVGPNNQVLDVNDQEIPGLYACGALTTLAFASVSTCAATGYWVGETLVGKYPEPDEM